MRGDRTWLVGLAVVGGCGGARAVTPVGPAPRPLMVTAMTGPFADTDAFCEAAIADQRARYPDSTAECWPVDPEDESHAELMPGLSLPAGPQPLAAPFGSLRFMAIGFDAATCAIAVEKDGGWYGAELGTSCATADNRSSSHLEVVEVAVRDLMPGGAPELLVRLREVEHQANLDNDGIASDVDAELAVVCGVGASGRPHCTEPLMTRRLWSVRAIEGMTPDPELVGSLGDLPARVSWQRELEYAADAMIVRGGDPDRVGRHPVVWP